MLSEPKFITREAQSYAAIRLAVPQDQIGQKAPPLVPEILGWAATHAKPAGPVFFNYTSMAPGRPMDMEVGVPIAAPVPGDARVVVGTLPGGRYATVTWTGPYDRLQDAHMALHDWLATQKLPLQAGQGGTTLLEIYINDPADVPPEQLITEIAFKLNG